MLIREMRIADYDKVYALWMTCTNMGFNNLDDSREGIEKFLKRNPGCSFLAEEEARVIGIIMAGHDGRRGYLYHLAVAEDRRREGIASQLLKHSLAALKAAGINKATLLVFRRNEQGNDFWEKQGFSLRDELYYRNKDLSEMLRFDT